MRLPALTALTALATLSLAAGLGAPDSALAATKAANKPPVKTSAKPAAKASAKPAAKAAVKAPAKSSAKAPAPLRNPADGFTEAQLEMAGQVQTGRADCEFKQFVMVERIHPQGGSFRVKHQSVTYTMVPEETSTGAVRLYDKKTGVVWLQIPVKSMLMNSRAGRRMVDACTQPAQRMAQAEADAAIAAAEAAAAAASSPEGIAAAAAAASASSVPPAVLGREDQTGALIRPTPAPPPVLPMSLLGGDRK